jgi:hypothetical protein
MWRGPGDGQPSALTGGERARKRQPDAVTVRPGPAEECLLRIDREPGALILDVDRWWKSS